MEQLNKLLINPATKRAIDAFISGDSHALLAVGPRGAGKRAILYAVAEAVGAGRVESQLTFDEEAKTIGIDEIRAVRERAKLRNREDETIAVILNDAGRLTEQAENALLKLLEEPPRGVKFLLSAGDYSELLPTIISRVTPINILKPSREELKRKFYNKPAKDVDTALAIADGWPGLTTDILTNPESQTMVNIDLAKQIIAGSNLERLKMIDKLTKQKTDIPELLFALERVLYVGLHASRKAGRDTTSWQSRLKCLIETEEALQRNVSTRLLLTRLMLVL